MVSNKLEKKGTDIYNQFAIIKVGEPLQKFEIQIQLKLYHFGFSIKALIQEYHSKNHTK